MKFVNAPEKLPEGMCHHTFYSSLYNYATGYNVYLPPDYSDGGGFPVAYHLHGWKGNESSEIWAMEKVCRNRRAITVFPNSSPVIEDREDWPVEQMLLNELMPHIDSEYRTLRNRDTTTISGFSMGGGMAFCYAIKHREIFSSVTAYAGTFHHYFHKGARTVGEAPEKASTLLEEMLSENRHFEEGNILCLLRENADILRGNLEINIHIGTDDILFCDNEIVHKYLTQLSIPHKYCVINEAGHKLEKII